MKITQESIMATNKSQIDGVQWATILIALIRLAPTLQQEVESLNMQFIDAYSLMSWRSVCRHLRCFANGMTVMRLLSEGKTHAEITEATGIKSPSISAYKGCNTASVKRCGHGDLVELNNNIITAYRKVIGENTNPKVSATHQLITANGVAGNRPHDGHHQ
jgi:uncharacterized protein YerC